MDSHIQMLLLQQALIDFFFLTRQMASYSKIMLWSLSSPVKLKAELLKQPLAHSEPETTGYYTKQITQITYQHVCLSQLEITLVFCGLHCKPALSDHMWFPILFKILNQAKEYKRQFRLWVKLSVCNTIHTLLCTVIFNPVYNMHRDESLL